MARPGLRQHPKFLRLVHLLGEPEPHVLGYLELMWDVGYRSGSPLLGDAVDVELAARYPGSSGKLFRALLDCRLIDEAAGKYHIHDLFDHAPEYVKKRVAREPARKRRFSPRSQPINGDELVRLQADIGGYSPTITELGGLIHGRRKQKGNQGVKAKGASGDVPPATLSSPPSSPPITPLITPSLFPPPPVGEESPTTPLTRRSAGADSGPSATPTPAPAPVNEPDPDPVVMTFPTAGVGAREWHLRRSKVRQYAEAFPGLDVEAECRKALQWVRDNPRRAKTPLGMPRFLGGWLGRSQDRAKVPSAGMPRQPRDPVANVHKVFDEKERGA